MDVVQNTVPIMAGGGQHVVQSSHQRGDTMLQDLYVSLVADVFGSVGSVYSLCEQPLITDTRWHNGLEYATSKSFSGELASANSPPTV